MVARRMGVKAVFDQAVDIATPAERKAYLDKICANEPDLRRDVDELLVAHEIAGNFLESPPPGINVDTEHQPTEGLGTVIGCYRLVELIGEGGFGAIYMAQQDAPVCRTVALKIIKLGMDTKEVIARFEAERQALAMMDHTNIAKVHDAGATEAGRPYFVMELVRGLPITEHCDKNNLTTEDRLELFIDVCHALQHAHVKGIIHRDIKPSNVMVTLVDDRPVPKVIDFGIAKATQKRLAEKTILTGDGQFLGTPQYMSPEQAGMSDLHVDIRTDVYSLGVLLYELLVGSTPFDPKRLREASYDEVCRIIRDTDPPTPSKQLSTLGAAAAEETSKQRQVQPNALQKQLRGDLDCIVMKTLEKDRDRRYDTAEALADDLRRFMDNKPIEAKNSTRTERVAKWSRRHSWGVATSIAAAFGILLVVAVVMWFGQRREAELHAQSRAERDRAEDNLQLAFDVMDQVNREFAETISSNGWGEKPVDQLYFTPEKEKWRRELLAFYEQFTTANRGVASAQSKNAKAYGRIGNIHSQLKNPDEANAAFSKATEIATELVAKYPTALEPKKCLATIYADRGFASYLTDDLEQAINELTKAIQLDPAAAWAFQCRGMVYKRRGDLERAIDDFSTSIRLGPKKADTYNQRAMAYTHKGDFEKAIPDYQEAIRLDPKEANTYNNLGLMYLKKGDTEQALAALTKAIQLNSDNAAAYTHRGNLYIKAGEFEKAIADYTEVIRIDPQRAYAYNHRGLAYWKMGDFDKAVNALKEAIRIDPQNAEYFSNLGVTYEKKGDVQQALAAYNEAIRIDPEHASAYINRGHLYKCAGDLDQAITDLDKAIQLNPKLAKAHVFRGDTYNDKSKFEQAIADFTEATRLDPQNGNTYNSLGFAYEKKGDLQQALAAYSEAIRLDPDLTFVYNNRGRLYMKTGGLDDAITELNKAIQHRPQFSEPYFHRGCVYSEQGDIEKGLADLAKAVELNTGRPEFSSAYALALLVSGNMGGYRSECDRMLERFGTVDDVHKVIWTAWTCTLAPQAVADPSVTVKLAEKTVRADPKSVVYVKTLGAALYRAGQVTQAIKRLNEADRLMQSTNEAAQLSPAYTWYFLSMAHHAEDHQDEARHWLDKAVKWTDERTRTNKQRDGTRLMWNRRATLNLLRAEAEAKLAASPN